ncbi:MAG: hypothetical protein ACYS3N_05570 [Planctomycetota bacterium]
MAWHQSSERKLITGFSGTFFGVLDSQAVITDGQWHHVVLAKCCRISILGRTEVDRKVVAIYRR